MEAPFRIPQEGVQKLLWPRDRAQILFTAVLISMALPLGILFLWYFGEPRFGLMPRVLMVPLGAFMVVGSIAQIFQLLRIRRGD